MIIVRRYRVRLYVIIRFSLCLLFKFMLPIVLFFQNYIPIHIVFKLYFYITKKFISAKLRINFRQRSLFVLREHIYISIISIKSSIMRYWIHQEFNSISLTLFFKIYTWYSIILPHWMVFIKNFAWLIIIFLCLKIKFQIINFISFSFLC